MRGPVINIILPIKKINWQWLHPFWQFNQVKWSTSRLGPEKIWKYSTKTLKGEKWLLPFRDCCIILSAYLGWWQHFLWLPWWCRYPGKRRSHWQTVRGYVHMTHQATVNALSPAVGRDYIIAVPESSAMLPWLHLQQRQPVPGPGTPSWWSESEPQADRLWRMEKKSLLKVRIHLSDVPYMSRF